MSHYNCLKTTLQSLEEQVQSLEDAPSLEMRWPNTNGSNDKEKWIYCNWDELTENFFSLPENKKLNDIRGDFSLTVIDPITSMREKRRVRQSFYDFTAEEFSKANRRRIRVLEKITERGYKSKHANDDTIHGKKDTERLWSLIKRGR
jgi:hypothetical protein